MQLLFTAFYITDASKACTVLNTSLVTFFTVPKSGFVKDFFSAHVSFYYCLAKDVCLCSVSLSVLLLLLCYCLFPSVVNFYAKPPQQILLKAEE